MSLDLDLSWTKIMIQTYMVHIFFIGVYPQLSTHEDSDLSTTLFKDQEMMRGNNNLLKVSLNRNLIFWDWGAGQKEKVTEKEAIKKIVFM